MIATLALLLGRAHDLRAQSAAIYNSDFGEESSKLSTEAEAKLHSEYGRRFQEMQRELADSNGGVKRGLHAKSHGCVSGTLEVASDASDEYLKGIFQRDKTYSVYGRFSNGSPLAQDDSERDFRGLAFRVFEVEGKRLEGYEKSIDQDFLLTNAPSHFAANSTEMMEFLEATHAGGLYFFSYAVTNPLKIKKILWGTNHEIKSPLRETYWSRAPFRHGAQAAKYKATPCKDGSHNQIEKPRNDSPNYLAEGMIEHFNNGGIGCFDFSVQYYVDQVKTPIEDTSVEWKESDAPFFKIARIKFFSLDGDNEKDRCEGYKFIPWNGVTEHRPLGEMNRARKKVYRLSQEERQAKDFE